MPQHQRTCVRAASVRRRCPASDVPPQPLTGRPALSPSIQRPHGHDCITIISCISARYRRAISPAPLYLRYINLRPHVRARARMRRREVI